MASDFKDDMLSSEDGEQHGARSPEERPDRKPAANDANFTLSAAASEWWNSEPALHRRAPLSEPLSAQQYG
jgi:hypothetical protein